MFFVILFFTGDDKATYSTTIYTAIAFVVGAVISIVCGAIGMVIATQTNYRTTYCAKRSLAAAFRTAFRAGCAMGFALVSLGLLVLMILIIIYKSAKDLNDSDLNSKYFEILFESIAGYGLGGSFVALFGRVGGGIYTKAADVGADLVGKV
jgi:Na+/H+-translocating membrane pyrophosphatase